MDNRARRSGRTTRLVDFAIQYLFREKKLYLVSGPDATESDIVDEDHLLNNTAQENFIKVLLKRIEIEHAHQFVIQQNKFHYTITMVTYGQ